MALVNSAFTVNVTPGAMPPIVHVSEYDIGRTYTVTINGQNGSAFNIPTGTTATVEGTLNGVIGFTTDATISGSTVSFALTESMTAVSGKAWCKIKLTLNDEPIQTCAFVLAVDRAGVEADTVIGADGFEQQIVNAVNNYLEDNIDIDEDVLQDAITAAVDEYVSEHGIVDEIAPAVTDWLDDNVTPIGSAVVVDSSLTVSGAAADAKVTGDEIGDLKSAIHSQIGEKTDNLSEELWDAGYIQSNGTISTDHPSLHSANFNPCQANHAYYVTQGPNYTIAAAIVCWYDSSKAFISRQPALNASVTSPANAAYFKISLYNYGTTYNWDIAVFDGSAARAYEPYYTAKDVRARAELSGVESSVEKLTGAVDDIKNVLPKEYTAVSPLNVATAKLIKQNATVGNSSDEDTTISVYEAKRGFAYKFTSASYGTASSSPAVALHNTDTVEVYKSAGTVLFSGSSTLSSVEFEYTPQTDGYFWVQAYHGFGVLSVYCNDYVDCASQESVESIKNEFDGEFDLIPKERMNGVVMTENSGYFFTASQVIAYASAKIYAFPVHRGFPYHIVSDSYKTDFDVYPVAVFTKSSTVAAGNFTGTVIIGALVTASPVNETYTPEEDGYIWINHLQYSGSISAYYYSYGSEIEKPVLYGKKIAVLGDSIMQYMSGGYGGSNVQTFVENGRSHTYDEITIANGIPYYDGNECTVVNEKQSYYDSQGWQYLLDATRASEVLNCSIGGSVLAEGTIATPYPGYEERTNHTNSLPNLVRWLFRKCENTSDPDLVVIWMGTNGIGMTDGDIDEIFALPWETLSGVEGHTYRQTNIGALRYAIERIYREMPHTYILVLGPIQADPARNPSRTFTRLLQRSNTMKSVSQRISVKFVEALTEVEIYGLVEAAGSNRYLVDGVHCTDAGKRLLTDFLNKKINSNYQYKY